METNVPHETKHHYNIGKLGEDLAFKYLRNAGYTVINRNYLKKYGEIDIVARGTGGKVHFIEVKTVSYETLDILKREVTRETWRPEELVHERKLHQIHKAVQSWLAKHNYQGEFQIDVLALRVVPKTKYATINYIENII